VLSKLELSRFEAFFLIRWIRWVEEFFRRDFFQTVGVLQELFTVSTILRNKLYKHYSQLSECSAKATPPSISSVSITKARKLKAGLVKAGLVKAQKLKFYLSSKKHQDAFIKTSKNKSSEALHLHLYLLRGAGIPYLHMLQCSDSFFHFQKTKIRIRINNLIGKIRQK
jgi:hypothetical protein